MKPLHFIRPASIGEGGSNGPSMSRFAGLVVLNNFIMKYWLGTNQQGIAEIIESNERPKMTSEGGPYGSLSTSYNSLDDLIKERRIHTEKCIECGGVISLNFMGDLPEKLKAKKLCFSCNHWVEIIEDKDNPRRCFVKGAAYWRKDFCNIRLEDQHVLGFSGAVFNIKMNSGEQYRTNDLWHNGMIPNRFTERLPDNAVFQGD
jgi:hypothetical protein